MRDPERPLAEVAPEALKSAHSEAPPLTRRPDLSGRVRRSPPVPAGDVKIVDLLREMAVPTTRSGELRREPLDGMSAAGGAGTDDLECLP